MRVGDGEAELPFLQMAFTVPTYECEVVSREAQCYGTRLLRLQTYLVECTQTTARQESSTL